MKNQQIFKRGNLVELLAGELIYDSFDGIKDISPEDIGRRAIIEGSYADIYGGDDVSNYSIIFQDTGESLAWKNESELRLIDRGGEHLLIKAKRIFDRNYIRDIDIKYILSKIDKGSLSSVSILFLFDILGYKSSFYKNGEYFMLFCDWGMWQPILAHIKKANTLEEAKSIFTEYGLHKYNIENVFNIFKNEMANNINQ